MAEDVKNRGYEEILKDLFFGKDAALDKFAKIRWTRYEILLWKKHGLPLEQVAPAAKAYFSRRFLGGQRIDKVEKYVLEKALESLSYAAGIDPDGKLVDTGCRARCRALVKELNVALKENDFAEVNVDKFIDMFTFDFSFSVDENGKHRKEPGYDFDIRHFYSDSNRWWFKNELDLMFKTKMRMPMDSVYVMAKHRRRFSKKSQ